VARVLDLASDSDSEPSEGGNVTLDAAWSGDSESEGDSADSDMDDPLRYFFSHRLPEFVNPFKCLCRHAGVYTEEEVVAQAKESMARLQNLYVREFRSLQFKLREQRRHYLAAVKKEKESMSEYLYKSLRIFPNDENETRNREMWRFLNRVAAVMTANCLALNL
jgi:hypothetical protein